MTIDTGRKIKVRYAAKCMACGRHLGVGATALWFKDEGVEHVDGEICDMYREQDAEMAAEQGFEARITGAWVNMPEYSAAAAEEAAYESMMEREGGDYY